MSNTLSLTDIGMSGKKMYVGITILISSQEHPDGYYPLSDIICGNIKIKETTIKWYTILAAVKIIGRLCYLIMS